VDTARQQSEPIEAGQKHYRGLHYEEHEENKAQKEK
jgi:hypothetical protein